MEHSSEHRIRVQRHRYRRRGAAVLRLPQTGLEGDRSMNRLVLLVMLAGTLLAAAPQAPRATKPDATASKAGAWRTLFDGKSLDAWRTYRSEAPPEKWEIRPGGVMFKDGNASDLVSKDE